MTACVTSPVTAAPVAVSLCAFEPSEHDIAYPSRNRTPTPFPLLAGINSRQRLQGRGGWRLGCFDFGGAGSMCGIGRGHPWSRLEMFKRLAPKNCRYHRYP